MAEADRRPPQLDPNRPLRRRCSLAATLEFADGRPTLPARVIDLSGAGAFVEVAPGAEFIDEGLLEIHVPEPLRLPVSIVRMGTHPQAVEDPRVGALTVSRQGLGLRFVQLEPGLSARLRGLLETLDEP